MRTGFILWLLVILSYPFGTYGIQIECNKANDLLGKYIELSELSDHSLNLSQCNREKSPGEVQRCKVSKLESYYDVRIKQLVLKAAEKAKDISILPADSGGNVVH